VLLRGGACDGPDVTHVRIPVPPKLPPITLPPSTLPKVPPVADPGPLCKTSAWASDGYSADAHAVNPGLGLAWSRTDVQGSGNGVEQDPQATDPYSAFGLGVHVDLFGADVYEATARSDGTAAPDRMVVAQGAGYGAGGVLANLGGDDRYDARALANGAAGGPVLAQADAFTMLVTFHTCLPTGTCATITQAVGLGVLVDVLGEDAYSQPCAFNGPPLVVVPAVWGNVPVLPSCVHNNGIASSGIILGVDAAV